MTSQVVSIGIIDDEVFEDRFENFTVTLSTDVAGLQLSNTFASVSIRDTDSEFSTILI